LRSMGDGKLGCAFGAFCTLHDFLAQLVVAELSSTARQGLTYIRRFHLADGRSLAERRTGTGEPQGVGI